MILSDSDILLHRDCITPFREENLQPASMDLTLDPTIYETDRRRHVKVTDGYSLAPGAFILASTDEVVSVPSHLLARVEGKSTWGRKGVLVHITAGFIDPGFTGNITLEMVNLSSQAVEIAAGQAICQLVFHRLTRPSENPYSKARGSHYQGQRGVTLPHDSLK